MIRRFLMPTQALASCLKLSLLALVVDGVIVIRFVDDLPLTALDALSTVFLSLPWIALGLHLWLVRRRSGLPQELTSAGDRS
jgi:hypothetical protein